MNLGDATRDLVGQVEQQTEYMDKGVTTVDDPPMDEIAITGLGSTQDYPVVTAELRVAAFVMNNRQPS